MDKNAEINNQKNLILVAGGLNELAKKYPNNRKVVDMVSAWNEVAVYINEIEKHNMEMQLRTKFTRERILKWINMNKYLNLWK